MAHFQYRQLTVTIYDRHESGNKRRGGDKIDRFCEVDDTGRPEPVSFPDQRGDDLVAFLTRTGQTFMAYLNSLGAEGWQVITYHPWLSGNWSRAMTEGFSFFRDAPPSGMYLLTRQVE